MIEITKQFAAEVKKIRKVTGVRGKDADILPTKTHITEFSKHAKDILSTIRQLCKLVEDKRAEYIGSTCSSEFNSFTDKERLDFDLSASGFISQCKDAIQFLTSHRTVNHDQLQQHQDGVIEVLSLQLHHACDTYSKVRAQHVSQTIERQKLGKLSSHKKVFSRITTIEDVNKYMDSTDTKYISDDEFQLTAEEFQALELENKNLYDEMTALSSEVRSIEGTVMEISRLQELFTEKVLTQAEQISDIHETAVETTENVRSGNEELREAIRNNAGFRVWVLFFFVMSSLCLLFLDWFS